MVTVREALLYGIVYVIFIVTDLIWIGGIMRNTYTEALGDKARMINGTLAPHWPSSLAVWALIVFGIFYFVLPLSRSVSSAALHGALYGLVLYGVYDLTNYATLSFWPAQLVFYDICWGITINGFVSAVAYYLINR
ncbi:MAG TPA: DUF2177 family protein [Candidatus Babeliales bacterium]|nr:DUF2177 family protein [Candidatus Babeliales bacterium]